MMAMMARDDLLLYITWRFASAASFGQRMLACATRRRRLRRGIYSEEAWRDVVCALVSFWHFFEVN